VGSQELIQFPINQFEVILIPYHFCHIRTHVQVLKESSRGPPVVVVAIASGCTAVVTFLKDNILYVINLGDSRCILWRDNKAFPLSSDHKPDDQSEKERIERAGDQVVCGRIIKDNKRINISRAFGDHLYKNNSSLPPKEQMIIAWPDVVVKQLKPNKDEFMVLV
jgi:protein phosphatase 1G